MKTIQIKITGADARVEQATVLTAGMAGVPVEFTFDDSWDGFQKTAVFTAGGVSRDVVDVENGCTVPHEVMTQPYRTLRIGIYGVQGNRAMPTVWANAGQILPGADPSGDPSAEPTLPVWQQIWQRLGDYYTKGGTQEYVDARVGEISRVLTELHKYAEALKGGESL